MGGDYYGRKLMETVHRLRVPTPWKKVWEIRNKFKKELFCNMYVIDTVCVLQNHVTIFNQRLITKMFC